MRTRLVPVFALLSLGAHGIAQSGSEGSSTKRPADGARDEELHAELARLVDITDPAERRRAADEFAARTPHGIEKLRAAMVSFGDFGAEPSGRSRVDVDLWIGRDRSKKGPKGKVPRSQGTEKTTLHLYVPKGYDPNEPAPLLLIGHWTGGAGDQALPQWIRLAEQLDAVLLAPSEAGPNGGWAFSRRERESARSAVRYARRRFNIDENRIYTTGVSRGGHMAWDLALRYPDMFAAIAPMIGGPRIKRVLGQNNMRYAENVVDLPIRDLQGSKDDPYLVSNLRLMFKRLKELGAKDAKLIEFPERGHSYDAGAVDWVAFFGKHRRDPRPSKVVRMMATKREARAFFVEVLEVDSKRVQEIPQIRSTRKFERLDEMGKREYVAQAIEKRTARLEVERIDKRKFTAKGKHVRAFRLLLDPSMFEPGKPVLVRYKGRQRRLKVAPSKSILLREFVERFDRTFLPVAAVTVR